MIDCEDLTLNVSREMLQHDRQVKAIRTFAVKKTLDAIERLQKDTPDAMRTLWTEFGAVLKEGLAASDEFRARLLGLLLCESSRAKGPTSLGDYVDRMGDDQEHIYYLGGTSLDAVRHSPHLESFVRKGVEVLFFADPVDEFWLQHDLSYKDKRFVSVSQGEVDFGKDATEADTPTDTSDDSRFDGLLQSLRTHLQDDIKDVRLSGRLTSSPACLVGDKDDMSPQLEEMMRRMGQEPPKTKRILEINPNHAFIGAAPCDACGKRQGTRARHLRASAPRPGDPGRRGNPAGPRRLQPYRDGRGEPGRRSEHRAGSGGPGHGHRDAPAGAGHRHRDASPGAAVVRVRARRPVMKRSPLVGALIWLTACGGGPEPAEPTADGAVAEPASVAAAPPYRVYVTNEGSGDLTVIAGGTHDVLATIPLGKRPRGIKVGPEGTRLFVALSGSPPAPPGVDEDTLPPPDRSADGIGIVDLAEGRVVRVLDAGTDPEQVAVSLDGARIFAANEDAGLATHRPGRER